MEIDLENNWDLTINESFQDKTIDKLKSISEILAEFKIPLDHVDLIVGHLIFLVPVDILASEELDLIILNYCKYISATYHSCVANNYKIEAIVDVINVLPLVMEDDDDFAKWSDFDKNFSFMSFQVSMRHRVFTNLKKLLPLEVCDRIIGKLNVVIDPSYMQKEGDEIEKILNVYCLSIYKCYKTLKKRLKTDTRFIHTAFMWQLFLLKPGEELEDLPNA